MVFQGLKPIAVGLNVNEVGLNAEGWSVKRQHQTAGKSTDSRLVFQGLKPIAVGLIVNEIGLNAEGWSAKRQHPNCRNNNGLPAGITKIITRTNYNKAETRL